MVRPRVVTQVELAKRLGVTQVTVSRALSGKAQMAPETRERVLALARELGYRANGLARRVQEGRCRGMALLGSSVRPSYNIWDQDFHMAVAAELAGRSWHLTEGWLPGEDLADPSVVDGLLDRMLADAVLVHDVGPQQPTVEGILARHHVVAVWVNTGRPANSVDFADADGARAGLLHLIAQGYRRPALMHAGSPPDAANEHVSVRERVRGFAAGCAEAGIPTRVLHPEYPASREAITAYIRQILATADRPDAVLCYNTPIACLVRLVAAELGLRIGPDLGLMCFGKAQEAAFDRPFTVCALDYVALGREAVRMAWRTLEGGRRQKQVLVPLVLQSAGASTTR